MVTRTYLRRDFRIRLLALVGILGLINFLLFGSAFRLDLTRDRLYSLSPASRTVAAKLTRPLQVKGYFTRDLEAPYNGFERALRDKLDEYQAFSGGKLRYEFKDPTGNQELEEEARRFGISQAKLDSRTRDKLEIKTAYLGVVFLYGDKQEAIPILQNLDGLEYDITRIIKRLTAESDKKTVAFVQGHGEPDLLRPPQQGGVNPFRQALEENYTVTNVDLSQKPEIPETVDALVVLAPQQDVPLRHQFEIDQFLMSGKPVGFILPGHLADMKQGRINLLPHNMGGLTEGYGVKLTGNLVLDRKQNGRTQFPVRQGRMVFQALINYPLYPMASSFDRESIIVSDLQAMVLPFQQALALTDAAKARKDLTARALVSSSETSAIKKAGAMPPLDPQALMDEEQAKDEDPGPFPLIYTLEGTFKSHWAEKGLPNEDGSLDGRQVVKESPKTRILVSGGAEFIRYGGDIFLNMVDWLAQDEDLISIRSRSESASPLKVLEPATQRLVAVANVVGVPLLFIVVGYLRWRMRRRAQAA